MKFIPAPGIVLVEPIEKEQTSGVVTTSKSTTRILKGKVLEVGPDLITNADALLVSRHYCKAGDKITFLSYEGDYDNFTHENRKYYVVKFEDIRGIYV